MAAASSIYHIVITYCKHPIHFHKAQAAAKAADAETVLQLEAARVQQLEEQLAMAAATLQQGLTTACHNFSGPDRQTDELFLPKGVLEAAV